MFDIVTALYNKASFIERTIESVVAQRFEDWRLFVVDDGSTDDGPKRVARFRDKRIHLIRQQNAGVGPARNAGIDAGSAAWVAFLDADDIWMSTHLEELDQLREAYPDAPLIGTAITRFSGEPPAEGQRKGVLRLSRYFHEAARGKVPFITSSAAVSRPALARWGVFEALNGNEDVELWARLAVHGTVAVSTRPTVFYRLDTGGITDQGSKQANAVLPMRREDMSSAIPTLDRLLPSVTDAALRQDIIEYMDSRIAILLMQAVRRGDLAYARHCRSLMQGQPRGQARIGAALAILPASLVRPLVGAAMAAKRAQRRLLNAAP